jgi:hypothetical protein
MTSMSFGRSGPYALVMPLETTTFERAIHLALFIVGGVAFAVGSLAVLERVASSSTDSRTISAVHIAVAVGVFVALALTEVVFHLLH